jgi:hypothetical protein
MSKSKALVSEVPVTLNLVAAITGISCRTLERLIEQEKLPLPDRKYRREWTEPAALTALAEKLAHLPEPSAGAASAIVEKLKEQRKSNEARAA